MESRHYLAPLFEPASLLAIVAGESPPAWVAQLLAQLAGANCSFSEYRLGARDPPAGSRYDLALILVGAGDVPAALEVAGRARCASCALLVDSPSDADVARWRDAGARAGVRILGPGTLGFVRPALGLNASRMGAMPPAGNVALVSQSGVLSSAILDWSTDAVIGFSLLVSLGAEADVDVAQVLDYLANDRATQAVVVYLEAVRKSRPFMSAMRALAAVKPVVVIKGQRHDELRARVLTHSGALAGSDAIYSAAFRRAGAVQIRLFTQMFTVARILAAYSSPVGKRIAIVSNGNGPAVLAADMAMWNAIELPPLALATRDALRERVPRARGENPVNLGVDADAAAFGAAIELVAADPDCDGVLVILAANAGADVERITLLVIEAAALVRKPVFACWMGGHTVRPLWRVLDDAGVPVFRTPEAAVDAYATVATFHRNQRLLQQIPRSLSSLRAPDLDAARALIARAQGREVLAETESNALLVAFHVPVSRTVLAHDADEAARAARAIGYPVVLKISSADIAHKSDAGAVALNIRNAAQVRAQHAALLAAVSRAEPRARIDGVSVQAMRSGPFARELYVGAFRDSQFGPVIAFGAGGTRVELVQDTTLEFPPLNRYLARQMIGRTRIAEALGQFRGMPAIEIDALENLLLRVSEMVCEFPEIVEMDINPVIADERGITVVDARIVVDCARATHGARHAHLAILPYPAHLTRGGSSPDGRSYEIRAIRPEDAEPLQAFVRGLSERTRYYRFMSMLAELSPRMLVRYTQVDYDRELALVAVDTAGAIVGVVRYLLNPDGKSCEFAVTITDGWQGQRLGTTLTRAILDAARSSGLARVEGYVLSENKRMLAMMRELGFEVRPIPGDATMRMVVRAP
ncbi:MAG: GNAT family N-acetyltransferase [Burkholderiaceae bacterium]|nr:GNAT family N-acetyltransferase [Burkholderiaceae bacterium]